MTFYSLLWKKKLNHFMSCNLNPCAPGHCHCGFNFQYVVQRHNFRINCEQWLTCYEMIRKIENASGVKIFFQVIKCIFVFERHYFDPEPSEKLNEQLKHSDHNFSRVSRRLRFAETWWVFQTPAALLMIFQYGEKDNHFQRFCTHREKMKTFALLLRPQLIRSFQSQDIH